jgi:hypothetical protein
VTKIPKVSLMVKCKVNGKWKNLPVQMSTNGCIKAIPGGTFYLRYNRNQWEPVGKDPDARWPPSAAGRFHWRESPAFR